MAEASQVTSRLPVDSGPSALGKYRILARLGEGGMAEVFLAAAQGPSGFTKLLVIKLLRESLEHDESFVKMFLDEARLAARLNHPNVVQTFEVGDFSGRRAIVMEYLDGRSLSAVRRESRKRGGLDLCTHLSIIADALSGLHHAHELRHFDGEALELVHRDFTANNIFMTFDGQVKVLDFGIAKARGQANQTRTGTVKGTLRYLAPETILGEPIDRRADIYAAGVLIWEAVAKRKLWQGDSEVSVMYKVANGEIPQLHDVVPDAPKELAEICARAMASAPGDRHENAEQLREELVNYVEEQSTRSSSRIFGPVLESWFREEREQVRQVINDQLAELEAESRTAGGHLEIVTLKGSNDRNTDTELTRTQAEWTPRRRRRSLRLYAIGAAIAVLGAGSWFALNGSRGSDVSSSAPNSADPSLRSPSDNPDVVEASAKAPGSAATVAVPSTVKLRVEVEPPQARLYLDDELLPGNPVELSIGRSEDSRMLRAEAPKFESRSMSLRPDRDISVSFALVKQRITKRRPRTVRTATAKQSAGETNPPSKSSPSKKPPRRGNLTGIDTDNPWAN